LAEEGRPSFGELRRSIAEARPHEQLSKTAELRAERAARRQRVGVRPYERVKKCR
jgi:hypothetical protein